MLQNNNQSMQTVVETFIIQETSELIHDNEALSKWNDRVNELELEGQREIVSVDKSPIPFLWMNTGLISTFSVLCPTKVKVEKYSKTPIPVEILDLISLSKKENYFDFIEIWYNDQDKDPVAVGYLVDQEYKSKEGWYHQHYSKKYLIGRWADVKASLDSLTIKAKALWISSTIGTLKQEIRDRQRKIEDVEEAANNQFGNSMPTTPDLPF
jgi:hypothetical protein